MRKKIAIFCGGPSSEYDVSIDSATTINKFIDKKKYEVYFFYIAKDRTCKLHLADGDIDLRSLKTTTDLIRGLLDLKKKKIFAFLAGIHGEFVEDGKLQSLLEFEKIPYSGSNDEASALCTDKMKAMIITHSLGYKYPKTIDLTKTSKLNIPNHLTYPQIVKPNSLGSSVGLAIVHDKKELTTHVNYLFNELAVDHILIQEYIKGIEVSCGVLEKKNGLITQLPPIEIHPEKSELFDYASKYSIGGSREITPPVSFGKEISDTISLATEKIHKALGCKTYSRSDFIVDGKNIYYLETNTLPGMTSTSLLPQEAKAAGMPFPTLLDFLIENS
ncbi:MAG: ATP-grasp domain-containing protein [Candidatus Levybacteria bacterium]|nr:ATP-grasp domain-containing protein [Candidatus Levybacteria bacterium]